MSLRRGYFHGWAVPLVLFGVVLLSYGLWIPWMGLFGNDLPYLWFYHLLGPWGPGVFAAMDRPLSAVFYAASTFALGENVWAYHVLLLILRWLSSVLLVWIVGLVWPGQKRIGLMAGLFLAVYPGFRQNPIALEFILHFSVLNLFLLSLAAGLLAIQQPKRYWIWTAAAVAGAAGLFWLEYFIGLEILRPIFLWLVTRQQGLTGRRQWKRILAGWLPAAGVVLAFLAWRIFIFSFPTYKPVLLQDLRANPLAGLLHLAQAAGQDIWTAVGRAWLQTLNFPQASGPGGRSLMAYLALAAAAFGLVWLAWRWVGRDTGADPQETKPLLGETMLGIGLAAMLAGGLIFWLTGIPVTLEFPWDRSTLSFMVGASFAVSGLVEMVVAQRYRLVIAAGLVALAVGMQFMNAQEYRAEWQKLRDFTWQLSWRAPQLEPGTLALFDEIPLNRYSDTDLTTLLNWTYAPDRHSLEIEYKFFDLNLRLGGPYSGLPGLKKDLPVESSQRGTIFKTTTSSMLVITYNPPACLRILSPEDIALPGITDQLAQVLPLSRLELVITSQEPARPPVQLGGEPAHGWCYYFQKADLARQQRDYAQAAALGDQAFAASLHPGDPSELVPFIEGYALGGNPGRALELSQEAGKQANLAPRLCGLWKQISTAVDPGAAVQDAARNARAALNCSP